MDGLHNPEQRAGSDDSAAATIMPGSGKAGSSSSTTGAHEESGPIKGLRSLMRQGLNVEWLSQAMSECDRLQERLETTAAEAEGLGQELLRAYEHLGIVFQLTRQVSGLTTERQVLDAFLAGLQSAYPSDRLSLIFLNGGAAASNGVPSDESAAAHRCRDEHRSVVDGGNEGSQGDLFHRISTPVFCGEDFVCAIQIERNDQRSAEPVSDDRQRPTRSYDSGDMLLLDSLASFCGDLLRNYRLLEALRQASMDTVRALVSAVDQKDPYTSGHSNRVGYYATLLGKAIGMADNELQNLQWSALLHDVGKIGIRDDVLNKVGRLTFEEFEHIKEHPRRGYEVVRKIPHFAKTLDGVLHHHEHYDGKGYPDGIRGESIPLQARVIQIADVFDALTTSRSYREAFTWRKALAVLREEAGTTVDPKLAESFESLLDRLYERRADLFEQIGKGMTVPDLEGHDDGIGTDLDRLGSETLMDAATLSKTEPESCN